MTKVKQVQSDATNIARNIWEFVEAASAVICAGFTIYASRHYEMRTEYRQILFVAGVVMALIGGRAIVKHFNK